MHPPSSGYKHVLGDSCTAEFAHIACVYALEEDKSLKIPCDFKKVSINPSTIAKTSLLHALSTCYALLCYLLVIYKKRCTSMLRSVFVTI